MRRVLPLLLAAAALAAAGCGNSTASSSSSSEKPATATSTPAPTPSSAQAVAAIARHISKNVAKKPKIPQPNGAPPLELVKRDIVKGHGRPARPGETARVQYVGVSWSTGQEFDSSWSRNQAFAFPLGAGQVIQGWDQGVVGMRTGGRRLLVIPPDLGYGPQGSPPAIGPNETLIFVIDLEQAK
jgi:FKBP-type peptidyl-prolyl cis-trans isomerase